MPNVNKLCVVQQTSDRTMAPPPGRHILSDGGRGTHLPKGVHADEPEGTRCMEQVFNIKLGVFLPSEDSHDGIGPPEFLLQLFEIFNEAVGMARASFHTGRAQFFCIMVTARGLAWPPPPRRAVSNQYCTRTDEG
jgi:hypothetical protein